MAVTSITSPSSEATVITALNKPRSFDDSKTNQTNQQSTAASFTKNTNITVSDSVSIKNAQEFLKKANEEIIKPDVLKSENKLLTKSEQDEKNPNKPEDLTKTKADGESLLRKGTVLFEYDALTKSSIVKFLDMKGNVISQVPPEQYLKTLQMSRSSPEEEKGTLLNKKV